MRSSWDHFGFGARPSSFSFSKSLFVAGIVLASAHPALGADRESQFDFQHARSLALLSSASVGAAHSNQFVQEWDQGPQLTNPWEISLTLPGNYNSNAETVPDGGDNAFEVTPEVRGQWAHIFGYTPLELGVALDLSSDRYAGVSDTNGDSGYADIRLQYYSPVDDQAFQPFLDYSVALNFAPTFGKWSGTLNDLSLGVDKSFNFEWGNGGGLVLMPHAAKSSSAADASLGFTIKVQRRFAVPGSSSTALYAISSATEVFSTSWSGTVEFDLTRRWYHAVKGVSESRWQLQPILTFEYTPPNDNFLSKIGNAVIDLQFSFAEQKSTLPSASYQQWTGGPSLKAKWDF